MSEDTGLRERAEELLDEARARKQEYEEAGGEETYYLDGRIAALEELLAYPSKAATA